MAEAVWQIELLGGFQVRQADRALIRFETQKTRVLLAYLAYFQGRAHPRAELIELLWPECDWRAGQHRLRQALYALRGQLEPAGQQPGSILDTSGATVRLCPAACSTDVTQFEEALRAAERAAAPGERAAHRVRAVELYRGSLLPGFYDDWVLRERQYREEQFFQALRGLIVHYEQAGDLDSALEFAQRAVSADPLREEAHHELIRLNVAAGRPRTALRRYRELERILQHELDLNPSAATRALARSIARSNEQEPELSGPEASATGPPLLVRTTAAGPSPPAGGAVALGSPLYIARPTDRELTAAVGRGDSIVLLKGTRQVGKSSLLARGLQQARQAGARVVRTDFQGFNAATLDAPETLLFALAQSMTDQLGLSAAPGEGWVPRRGPNANFEWFLERHLLGKESAPLVWGLDQVDRLFSCAAGPDLFGMFRAWHNERALDPDGPWSRLTLVIAYATEAHLFIRDDAQSPFNVGTRLTLADLSREQVEELNRRYGQPLPDDAALERFWSLVGGHPYLAHRGLQELAQRGTRLADLETHAASEEGIYSDHLRRFRALLTQDPELCEAIRLVLQGRPCPTLASFYRLRSAGAVVGESEQDARPRCRLYTLYLERHLPPPRRQA